MRAVSGGLRMIKLWGRNTSANVMKALWVLDEAGVAYHRIDLGGPFGGNDDPAYRAINPLGVVPTLEEPDGFTVFESNVILRYVGNVYAPQFYPVEARARSAVDTWLDFQQTTQNSPQARVFQGLVRMQPEQRDLAAIAKAETRLAMVYGILEAQLAKHAYIASADFGIADMAYGAHVHRWFQLPISRPETPNLRGWYERLLERPAFQKHCAVPLG
jgi:glutathione S-transferase